MDHTMVANLNKLCECLLPTNSLNATSVLCHKDSSSSNRIAGVEVQGVVWQCVVDCVLVAVWQTCVICKSVYKHTTSLLFCDQQIYYNHEFLESEN